MGRYSVTRWLLLVSACLSQRAEAWIFPEHRDIGRAAIAQLSVDERAELARVWTQANPGQSNRFCETSSESEEEPKRGGTPCADLAMLFALAGDHSCSPEDLEATVLRSDWFPELPAFIAALKKDLKDSKSFENKLSIWNDSNVSLLKIDEKYLSRAAGNNAHFPIDTLPIRDRETIDVFLKRSTLPGAPVNAVGIYARYHVAAIQYARLGKVREALLSEAFAAHFLEDLFSSGHYAGTWGGPAERKGTHDYYCSKGLDTVTWGGERYGGHGDAFLTEEDLKHSSKAVRDSLAQFLRAFRERKGETKDAVPTAFQNEICKSATLGDAPAFRESELAQLKVILNEEPIPSEGQEGGSLPRHRIETGPFLSANAGFRFGVAQGGLLDEGVSARAVHRIELLGRLGMGTVGVLSDHSDGAMFVELGLIADGHQPGNPRFNSRPGQKVGIRMPFWILPGDLLILGPTLYFTNRRSLQNVVISAANGGLLGIERKISTSIGSLQLMAGRQVDVSLYGYLWNSAPLVSNENGTTIGSYRSIELDFPLITYEPGRAFANRLAFDFETQLGFALEMPNSVSGVSIGNSPVVYIRFSLEGIKYL